ncbi:DMT family transporter [Dichotomicrobium thermohalophilum]|uniref:Threonine/homoserine efflux transporter RhtA n=1 Tax=Dichotomicrobium thermohalophilum TaxID=933063 RepID=A0A397Q6R5_9HYPH|nr:DMT family transporter [Dichotomicrobium thermohalophilum]RIA55227.1 threonine/homoserine efflux transporter RhtA [Dichotomicrobium thermohalophilum]
MNIRQRVRQTDATPAFEVGLVICWSSGFIGGLLASETSSIYLVLFWRFLLLALLLLPFTVLALTRLDRRQLTVQTGVGLLGMFGYTASVISAIKFGVPAGTVALIAALQPLAAAALAGTVLSEIVSPRQWLGLGVGFFGVFLAVSGAVDAAPVWAYALAFLSMLCLVVATLVAKAQSCPVPVLSSLTIQCAVSAVLYLPLAIAAGESVLPEANWSFVYAVAWFILFSTLGGFGLYWATLRRTSATRVSSLIYLTPPVTAIWAWAMFGQPLTLGAALGFVICLLGVHLSKGMGSRPAAPIRPGCSDAGVSSC